MFYAVIFFTILVLLFLLLDVKKPPKFPPGPKWYPFVGCALQISQLRVRHGLLCKVIDEIAKYYVNPYGLYGLKIGRDKLVVCYYHDSINEMMTNEDLDGKPDGIFFRTRTFNAKKGILTTDGDAWLDQRRFILRNLKDFGFARRGMIDSVQNEAAHLLAELKARIGQNDGKSARVHMQSLFTVYVLNTLWTMMASKRYDLNSKEINGLLSMFFELLANVDVFGTLFSHFPILRFVAPHYSGYASFVDSHRRFYEFLRKEIEVHRQTYKHYDTPRDLIDSYLREIDSGEANEQFDDEQLMSVCLDLFLAGSETTTKSIGMAFLHLVRNPELQERAFAEIKEVVGLERLPEWRDRSKMPFCEGIVLEALRFFMGHTFAIPHRAICDTRLSGYEIPKDTWVVGCYRGMLMNPHDYPNPEIFDPTRYIVDGVLKVPESHNPFGFGRHRCMGEQLGRQNLFMLTTTVLQSFRFLPVPGEMPSEEYLDGATAAAKPFDAIIVPRQGVVLT